MSVQSWVSKFEQARSVMELVNRDAEKDLTLATVSGGQWSDNYNASHYSDNHVKFEVNRIINSINQVYGEYLENTLDMKVEPSKVGVYDEKADIYNDLLRKYMYNSDFSQCRDSAFKEALLTGMGAWYIDTEYTSPFSFNKDLVYKKIPYAFNRVYWLGSYYIQGADEVFFLNSMSRQKFKDLYGVTTSGFTLNNTSILSNYGYSDYEDQIYFLDVYYKKREYFYLVETEDGSELLPYDINNPPIGRRWRVTDIEKIYFTRITSGQVLIPEREFPSKYFPISIVYGHIYQYTSHISYHGLPYFARDSQRLYNYILSIQTEIMSSIANRPILVTPANIQGYESLYEHYNNRRTPFLPYNKDPEEGTAPLLSDQLSNFEGFSRLLANADRDIQATVGRYSASLGEDSSTTNESGLALNIQQKRGDLSSGELFNNLIRAVEWSGRITISMLDDILKDETSVLGKSINGDMVTHRINRGSANSLSSEEFDVVATVSASFQSRREESLTNLVRLFQEDENLRAIGMDLLVKNLDIPDKEELLERLSPNIGEEGVNKI